MTSHLLNQQACLVTGKMRMRTFKLLLLSLALAELVQGEDSNIVSSPGIIRVLEQRFVDAQCREFVFSGASSSLPNVAAPSENADSKAHPVILKALNLPAVPAAVDVWQLLEASAGAVGSSADVAKMFQSAKAEGINLIRFFPFGISSDIQLQTGPGNFRAHFYIFSTP